MTVRHDTAGMVVIDIEKQSVLLIFDDTTGQWGFPVTHVNPGEVRFSAGLRKVRESAGVQARLYAPAHWENVEYQVTEEVAPGPPEHLHDHHLYIARPVGGQQSGGLWVNVFQHSVKTTGDVREGVTDRALKAYWLLRMAAEDIGGLTR